MRNFDQFGATYDFERFVGTPQVYMIASTPRSGSHLLGHLLFATGSLGSPVEYFHPDLFRRWRRLIGSPDPAMVVREIISRRTSPTGWFGFKAHWHQFVFLNSLGLPQDLIRISRIVWIRRRDVLDQAISMVIAAQTDSWISFNAAAREPVYDGAKITATIRRLTQGDANWRGFFRDVGLSPHTVFYEDLAADPQAHVNALLEWFGLPPPAEPIVPMTSRQATERNRVWKERFLAERGCAPDGRSAVAGG